MRYVERKCTQCGEPIEGRANKKFCSAACRAQHFRASQEELDEENDELLPQPQRMTSVPIITPTSLHARPVYNDEEEEDKSDDDWSSRYESERKAKEEVEKTAELHKRYSKLIMGCLKVDGDALHEEELQTWLDELDELSDDYRTHPGLRRPTDQAHQRLEDIYWLRDKFRRLLEEWEDQPTSWLKEAEPVYFELSSKRRALFRAHLLN